MSITPTTTPVSTTAASSSTTNHHGIHEKDDPSKKDDFNLDEAFETLSHANWTSVVSEIRDPANKDYLIALTMTACLILSFFGYTWIRVWLFFGGFISCAASFFILSPNVFDTDICCGPGTEKARLAISLSLGVVGGCLALWVLKMGIFLVGSCLGLAISMPIKSLLSQFDVLHDQLHFAMLYLGMALVGGVLSMFFEKPIIILATAATGSFGFMIGVGYFFHCDFLMVMELLKTEIQKHARYKPLPQCDTILAIAGLVLFIGSVLVQYRWSTDQQAAKDKVALESSHRSQHGHHHHPLHGPKEVVIIRETRRTKRKRRKRRWRDESPTRDTHPRSPTPSHRSQGRRRWRRLRMTDGDGPPRESSTFWFLWPFAQGSESSTSASRARARTKRRQQRLLNQGFSTYSSSEDV